VIVYNRAVALASVGHYQEAADLIEVRFHISSGVFIPVNWEIHLKNNQGIFKAKLQND
jgi:hypothetical protein